MRGPGNHRPKNMARRLIKGESVLFTSGDSKQVGIITDTYVRQRKRLYTVQAETGDLYTDMPVDTKISPRYRIELSLTERYNKKLAVDGGQEPETDSLTEAPIGELDVDGTIDTHGDTPTGAYIVDPLLYGVTSLHKPTDGTPDPEITS